MRSGPFFAAAHVFRQIHSRGNLVGSNICEPALAPPVIASRETCARSPGHCSAPRPRDNKTKKRVQRQQRRPVSWRPNPTLIRQLRSTPLWFAGNRRSNARHASVLRLAKSRKLLTRRKQQMNLVKSPHRNSTRRRRALFQRRRQMHDPLLVLNKSPDRPLAGSSFTPKLRLRVVGRTEG